jgi:hypothetical protein
MASRARLNRVQSPLAPSASNDLVRLADVPSDVTVWKTSVQSKTNNTLIDVTELLVPVAASSKYAFMSWIQFDGISAADIRFAFTVPSGATLNWSIEGHPSGVASPFTQSIHAVTTTSGGFVSLACNGTGVPMSCRPGGSVLTGGTAGNLQLQFCQVATNATASRVYDLSWLRVWKVP